MRRATNLGGVSRSRRPYLQTGCNVFFFKIESAESVVGKAMLMAYMSQARSDQPPQTVSECLVASFRAHHLDGQWHLSSGYELGQLPLQLFVSITYQIDGSAGSILRQHSQKVPMLCKAVPAHVAYRPRFDQARGPAESKMTHLPHLPTRRYPAAYPTCSTFFRCYPDPPATHRPTRQDTAQPIYAPYTR